MRKKLVISGSFRHLPQLREANEAFERIGFEVLAPKEFEAAESRRGFALLPSDPQSKKNRRIQTNFMRQLRQVHFHYLVIPDGRIGQSVATEIAYAALKGKPVIASRQPVRFAKEMTRRERQMLLKKIAAVVPPHAISRKKFVSVSPRKVTIKERPQIRGLIRKLLETL